MLLRNKSFKINEYVVPEFTLKEGEMIRFWVEIIPEIENDTDGYWGTKKMQNTIQYLNRKNLRIEYCSNKVKRNFFDFLNPISTGEYLKSKFELRNKEVEEILSQFDIRPKYKVRNLGTSHQKIFSIICGFQKSKIVSFDYFGLSPNTEEQLTTFVKTEIDKGKAAISFDSFHYKSEIERSENIINLDIRRIRNRD